MRGGLCGGGLRASGGELGAGGGARGGGGLNEGRGCAAGLIGGAGDGVLVGGLGRNGGLGGGELGVGGGGPVGGPSGFGGGERGGERGGNGLLADGGIGGELVDWLGVGGGTGAGAGLGGGRSVASGGGGGGLGGGGLGGGGAWSGGEELGKGLANGGGGRCCWLDEGLGEADGGGRTTRGGGGDRRVVGAMRRDGNGEVVGSGMDEAAPGVAASASAAIVRARTSALRCAIGRRTQRRRGRPLGRKSEIDCQAKCRWKEHSPKKEGKRPFFSFGRKRRPVHLNCPVLRIERCECRCTQPGLGAARVARGVWYFFALTACAAEALRRRRAAAPVRPLNVACFGLVSRVGEWQGKGSFHGHEAGGSERGVGRAPVAQPPRRRTSRTRCAWVAVGGAAQSRANEGLGLGPVAVCELKGLHT